MKRNKPHIHICLTCHRRRVCRNRCKEYDEVCWSCLTPALVQRKV